METIEVYTLQGVESQIKARANSGQWYVLRFAGFAFKIYNKWAQIMQTPQGLRDSGASGHKSARALFAEVSRFIESNQTRAGV